MVFRSRCGTWRQGFSVEVAVLGWQLGLTVLEVFSNLKDSVVLQKRTVLAIKGTKAMLCCC